MYSSSNDMKDKGDVNDNSQLRQTNTPPHISNRSQSSSPSCSTLLVIDDTSNSEDSTINNTNNTPTKPMPSTNTLTSHIQIPKTLSPSTLDMVIGTVEQQRRRNSSIAKILGGHPLNNQQYEEINQQIIDNQSAQNLTNNYDNGIDNGIQRSRSSITRTLLMNAERTNSMTKLPSKTPTASAPSFTKDFEYLIRRELDNEHAPSTLQRDNSAPKVNQILNSASTTAAQSPVPLKLKRKRPVSKASLPTANKSATNIPPFSLHDPFELESSTTNPIPSVNQSQNKFLHFDPSKRPRYPNEQQYHSPTNQFSYPYHHIHLNSSLYNQFNIHQEHLSSNTGSSSCNCSHYSHSTKLTLPPPSITALLPPTTIPHNNKNVTMTSTRKAKSMPVRPDIYELSRQRSYSNPSNQSDLSLEASSKTTIPLKKRLLDAYNNEHHPTSSL